MLHIILGILKVIGIILGIIILLLLASVLAVVFVPVRYQIKVEKQPRREADGQDTDERVRAEAKVSWLLHIFSVCVSLDLKRELDIAVRLFGIRLPLFGKKQKRKNSSDGASHTSRRRNPDTEADPDEDGRAGNGAVKAGAGTVTIPESAKASVIVSESATEYTDAREGVAMGPKAPANASAFADGPEQVRDRTASAEDGSDFDAKPSLLDKIWFVIQRIYDKIKKILQTIRRFLVGVANLPETLDRLWERIMRVLRRPRELLELAQRLEAQELLGDGLEYLKYLLLHFKPRRIKGHLKFGTGDPALSAQLTGLIYLLLPARADRFTIDTEFNESVFEIEMICSGHIRAVHAIRVLWRAFRNKKLRRLIRYLRKRK